MPVIPTLAGFLSSCESQREGPRFVFFPPFIRNLDGRHVWLERGSEERTRRAASGCVMNCVEEYK